MATEAKIAFLLAETRRWYDEGLLDHPTYQAIQQQYGGGGPQAPQEDPAEQDLEQELEEQALLLVGDDAPPEPDLDEYLEAEASFHIDLQQRVEAAAEEQQQARSQALSVPASERPGSLSAAVSSATKDLMGVLEEGPAEDVSPAEEVLQRDSLWSTRLRPFLHENALWLASGLLILCGSLYFLRLVWNDLSSLLLHSVISLSLLLYAGAFFSVGYVLIRKRGAQTVGRILFCFSMAILPLAGVAVGELAGVMVREGLPFLAPVVMLAALAVQGFILFIIAGLFERSAIKPLSRPALLISALTLSVAPLEALASPGNLLLAALPLGLAALHLSLRQVLSDGVNLRASILFVGGSLLWSLTVLVGRVHVAAPVSPTYYASLAAGLVAVLLVAERRLRRRDGLAPCLTPPSLVMYGALLASLVWSLAGLAIHGYFDLWSRLGVLVCSTVGVVLFAQAAVRHGRGAMTHLAASAGLLTYFFLPAPFSGLLRLAQRWVNAALGYQNEPMPVAYYGLTFIPYLVGLTLLAAYLRQRRADLSWDLQRFLMVLGTLLVVLAAAAKGDLRPMLWTWPVYAAGAFVWAAVFHMPRLRYAGQAILLALLWVVGAWLARQFSLPCTAALLAAHGFLLAAASMLYRHRSLPELGHGALAAAALSLLALLAAPANHLSVCLALILTTFVLGLLAWRYASRLAAHLAGLLSLSTTISWMVYWSPSEPTLIIILLAYASAAALLAHVLRRGASLARSPAVVAGLLGASIALLYSLMDHNLPLLSRGLAAALFIHLALISRSWPAMAASALGAALAGSVLTVEVAERGSPFTLTLLSMVYLLGATRIVGRRSRALTVCAFLVAGVGVWTALAFANTEAAQRFLWSAAACGAAALFSLAACYRYRQRQVAGVAALACLALASTAAGALLLQHLVPPSPASAWSLVALLAGLSLAWTRAAKSIPLPLLSRASLSAGGLLTLPALLCLAVFTALSCLQCGPHSARILGLFNLEAHVFALLCSGLLVLATWFHDHQQGSAYSRHLLIAAAVGLVLVLFRLTAPSLHLSPALLAPALALAALAKRRQPLIILGWPLALCALALLASHAHLHLPHLLLSLAGLTAVLALNWRPPMALPERSIPLQWGWAIGFALTIQASAVWLAELLSTGRHPRPAVLIVMGTAALATWAMLARVCRAAAPEEALEHAATVSRLCLPAAAALSFAGVLLCGPEVPLDALLLGALTLALLCLLMPSLGLRQERPWLVHASAAALTLLYILLRHRTALSVIGAPLDAAVILVASQAALWFSRAQADILRRPLLTATLLWPLASLTLLPSLDLGGAALLCLLTALHYSMAASALRARLLSVPAMIFSNAALILSYGMMGWSDLLLYVLPISFSLLVLIHLYRQELGAQGSKATRTVVLVGLYSLSTGQALLTLSPLTALVVVPALCVAGLVVGTMFRIRIYVLMGVGFLAADLLLNMLQYGLMRPHLGALFLTLLGLILVVGMVVFTLERERILSRYSVIFNELRTWE